jgi:peptidoglycan/LPS O-acetylase OafA/YrhL
MSAGIEAARFALALSVALFHWNGCLPSAYLAVDIFFVISGLMIGRRYEDALRRGGSLRAFAIGRAIRLYPLYLLGALAGTAAAWLAGLVTPDWSFSLPGLAWRALLLVPILGPDTQPAGIQSFPLDVPAWSLWCEIIANLLFGLFCRLPRWAAAVPAAIGAAVLAEAAATHANLSLGGDGQTVLYGLARIGFGFFAGVLLGRIRGPVVTGSRGRLAIAALLAALVLLFRLNGPGPDHALVALVLVVLVFPPLAWCIACCEPGGPLARWAIAGGGLSYALYILHAPLYRVLRSTGLPRATLVSAPVSAAVLLLLVGAAFAATAWFDTPLRRRLKEARRRVGTLIPGLAS